MKNLFPWIILSGLPVVKGCGNYKMLQLSVQAHPGAKLVYDDTQLSDGTVGVDLKFTNGTSSSNNAGLLLRVGEYGGGADNFDGYEVSLFADGKRLLLGNTCITGKS